MGFSTFLTAVGVGTSVAAASEQKKLTGEQVTAQKGIQKEQKKLADIKSQRERRKTIQAKLKAESDILVASGEQGSDSRTAGVIGSVRTKAAGSIAYAGQQEQISTNIFNLGLDASNASAGIAGAQALFQVGGAVTSAASIFNDPSLTTKPPGTN